jgi:hypothetical protein
MIAAEPVFPQAIKTRLPAEYRGYNANNSPQPLATMLGLFSIGLGLWEVLAPHDVARRTGVRYPGLIRAYGFREIISGLAILGDKTPAEGLWSRVAGDALDLATLGAAYAEGTPDDRRKACIAAGAVLGVTLLDVLSAQDHIRHDR